MIMPITPKGSTINATTGNPGTTTTPHYHHHHHHTSQQQPFPLGQLFEDLTLTLSLRNAQTAPNNNNNNNNNSVPYLIWVVTLQFMLSCLRNNSPQALYNAGIATPVILGIIKHILLELTRLPATNMTTAQKKCFVVGKQMLDIFLVHDTPSSSSTSTGSSSSSSTLLPLLHQNL